MKVSFFEKYALLRVGKRKNAFVIYNTKLTVFVVKLLILFYQLLILNLLLCDF